MLYLASIITKRSRLDMCLALRLPMDELKEVGACLALLLLLLMLLEVTEAEKDPKLRTPKSRLVQGPDRRAASDGAAVT
jgi:hypothetical protein